MGFHREWRRLRHLGAAQFIFYYFRSSKRRSQSDAQEICVKAEVRPDVTLHVEPVSTNDISDAPTDEATNAPVLNEEFNRRDVLLAGIDKGMKILEVGPGYNPLVRKSEGWNVYSLDHATAEELRRKYANDQAVDISRIEPVDFVDRGDGIDGSIPSYLHGSFDACIASHVIEHIPDPIRFFRSVGLLLREGGIFSLAVPDKRFTFDFFRHLSSTGDWLEAFEKQRTRHTKARLFDQVASSVQVNKRIVWQLDFEGEISPLPPGFSSAKNLFDSTSEDPAKPYVDCHAWCFTPSSFALLTTDLQYLDLVPFDVDRKHDTVGCEFFVTLRKTERPSKPENIDALRLSFMRQIFAELGEQVDLLKRLS